MVELFQEQIKRNELITQEVLDKLIDKNYHCGEPINVGDNRLWAFLYEDGGIRKLISLKEEHIDLYCDGYFKGAFSTIPIVKLK
jgi:hypothetical protein